jgi:hypothetical protein
VYNTIPEPEPESARNRLLLGVVAASFQAPSTSVWVISGIVVHLGLQRLQSKGWTRRAGFKLPPSRCLNRSLLSILLEYPPSQQRSRLSFFSIRTLAPLFRIPRSLISQSHHFPKALSSQLIIKAHVVGYGARFEHCSSTTHHLQQRQPWALFTTKAAIHGILVLEYCLSQTFLHQLDHDPGWIRAGELPCSTLDIGFTSLFLNHPQG